MKHGALGPVEIEEQAPGSYKVSPKPIGQEIEELFADLGLGDFSPEQIAEAYVRDFLDEFPGRAPQGELLTGARRLEGILLQLESWGADMDLSSDRNEEGLTEAQVRRFTTVYPAILRLINQAERGLRAQYANRVNSEACQPTSERVCRRTGARARAARPGTARHQGSRRVTSRSAGGGDSDSGDSDGPSDGRLQHVSNVVSLLAPFASERFGNVNGAARQLLRELGEWS